MMKAFYICLVAIFVTTLVSCSWIGWKSRILETWQTDNGALKIRITSYNDPGFVIEPGAYYVFESSLGNDDWQKIATVHKDIAEPINKKTVHFVNDQIAFVSMHWMFASTTNGGREWVVWDSRNHKYSNTDIEWGIVEYVSINAEGNGEMTLKVFPSSNACLAFFSQDFGRTWIETGPLGECSD